MIDIKYEEDSWMQLNVEEKKYTIKHAFGVTILVWDKKNMSSKHEVLAGIIKKTWW